eukprot:COSAG05_NODE_5548_length_1145_cov_1.347992_1_plen_79_part_10
MERLGAACPTELKSCGVGSPCGQRLATMFGGAIQEWGGEPEPLQDLYLCHLLRLRDSGTCSSQSTVVGQFSRTVLRKYC